MQAQHSYTWDSAPKEHGSQSWGKGESAPECSAQGWNIPSAGGNTAAPAHTAETAGTPIELFYSKCWQRKDGRGWTWRSTEDHLKNNLKSII